MMELVYLMLQFAMYLGCLVDRLFELAKIEVTTEIRFKQENQRPPFCWNSAIIQDKRLALFK